jgi:hypothetical protein
MLNNFNIRSSHGTQDVQSVFKFPPSVLHFQLLFGAEHYQSLKIALTNVG